MIIKLPLVAEIIRWHDDERLEHIMTETERHQHTKMTKAKAKATAENDDRADDDGDDGTRNMKPFFNTLFGQTCI